MLTSCPSRLKTQRGQIEAIGFMGRCVDLLVRLLYIEAMEMRLIDRPLPRRVSVTN